MKLTYEEISFLVSSLYTAHGPGEETGLVSERRQAANLIDRLGAEPMGSKRYLLVNMAATPSDARANFQTPPDFSVAHLSSHLRDLADRDEQRYGV